jgi:hypothetical protein
MFFAQLLDGGLLLLGGVGPAEGFSAALAQQRVVLAGEDQSLPLGGVGQCGTQDGFEKGPFHTLVVGEEPVSLRTVLIGATPGLQAGRDGFRTLGAKQAQAQVDGGGTRSRIVEGPTHLGEQMSERIEQGSVHGR